MSIETKSLDDLRARIAQLQKRLREMTADRDFHRRQRLRAEADCEQAWAALRGLVAEGIRNNGSESGDVSTHVVVPIDKELAMLLAQYLMTHGQLQHSMVASDFERSGDGRRRGIATTDGQ